MTVEIPKVNGLAKETLRLILPAIIAVVGSWISVQTSGYNGPPCCPKDEAEEGQEKKQHVEAHGFTSGVCGRARSSTRILASWSTRRPSRIA